MDLKELPTLASLEQYERQAKDLLEACEAKWIEEVKRHLSRSGKGPDSGNSDAAFTLADAQLALARWYYLENWPRL